MAANKKPGGGDRPLIRSSHGGATPRSSGGPGAKKKARASLPGVRPARATAPRSRREGADTGPKKARPPASQEPKSLGASAPRAASPVSTASDEARALAVLVATAAIEKKASGLEVIDVAGRVDYADFLVLMSGRSDRHVTALSAAIEEALRKKNKRALAVEGLPHASWVLMDFGDVVVHVFQDDARAAYDIDGLWMDARRVPVSLS
ncbi:MAG: ribosome silencing factor [Labilithrix sp.]|nr:ribosome silencing factor [Labilithrix sp.]MCW5814468.1 ribosome silencing factor [Labilithrix sp.]